MTANEMKLMQAVPSEYKLLDIGGQVIFAHYSADGGLCSSSMFVVYTGSADGVEQFGLPDGKWHQNGDKGKWFVARVPLDGDPVAVLKAIPRE